MAERRPLVAGLKPAAEIDPSREKKFVFGEKPEQAQPATEPREKSGANSVSRVPLTTRVRADYGAALKRASLERQLNGKFPNTVQHILEDALGPWLKANGYIP